MAHPSNKFGWEHKNRTDLLQYVFWMISEREKERKKRRSLLVNVNSCRIGLFLFLVIQNKTRDYVAVVGTDNNNKRDTSNMYTHSSV